jgi:glycosyltransferase involved in cell wall biosynthesis
MAKIVHFGKYYFPETGGIESVTASLARGAAQKDHRVSVVCFDKHSGHERALIDGVDVIRVPIGKMVASQPLGFGYFVKCLQQGRYADVVHLHAPNMLGALASLFIGKRARLLVHWHSDVINKGMLGKLTRPLETALLKRADAIIATSEVYADASETLRPYRKKIQVVPIGVPDVSDAQGHVDDQPSPELQRAILGKKLILSVGRLVPYKGFDVLIRAAKHLVDDAVMVIVGGGPLKDELQAIIDATGVSDRVYLAGRLSDAVLHSLFRSAQLYCLPSTYRAEAFGVVLLEAMAYGVPIVATDIPGSAVPWVNAHGVSGVNVPVNDPEALAAACNDILSSHEKRTQFAQGARQRFVNEFTEQESVRKMLSAYARLMAS